MQGGIRKGEGGSDVLTKNSQLGDILVCVVVSFRQNEVRRNNLLLQQIVAH